MLASRRFRPGLWLTLCALVAIAILIGLGAWQLQRLSWKQALIEQRAAQLEQPAVALPDSVETPEDWELRRVRLSGRFLDREFHLGGRSRRGEAGFHIVAPLLLDDGRSILVDRGWVPAAARDPARRPESRPAEGPLSFEAVLRSGGWKGRALFRPDNAPQENYWIWLDLPLMTELAGLERPLTTLYAAALPSGDAGALPIAEAPNVAVRNDHLQYALTWFALAIALAVIYVMLALRREEP